MKNKAKFLGLIALAVIIGFSMAGCDNGGGGGGGGGGGASDFNTLLTQLTSGDPTNGILSNFNNIELTTNWPTIRAAAGGVYRGYKYDGDLDVIFTGTTKTQYDNIKNTSITNGMLVYKAEQTGNGLTYIELKDNDSVTGFSLLYSAGGSHPQLGGGVFIPSGTIYISFDPNITD